MKDDQHLLRVAGRRCPSREAHGYPAQPTRSMITTVLYSGLLLTVS